VLGRWNESYGSQAIAAGKRNGNGRRQLLELLACRGAGAADLWPTFCIFLANRVEQAADLWAASMIVGAGHLSLRGRAYRLRGANDLLDLRDDYLKLLKREEQTKADRQKTDRQLGVDQRPPEVPIVVTAVYPIGNGLYSTDGIAYAGQCLAEWIVFLAKRPAALEQPPNLIEPILATKILTLSGGTIGETSTWLTRARRKGYRQRQRALLDSPGGTLRW